MIQLTEDTLTKLRALSLLIDHHRQLIAQLERDMAQAAGLDPNKTYHVDLQVGTAIEVSNGQ